MLRPSADGLCMSGRFFHIFRGPTVYGVLRLATAHCLLPIAVGGSAALPLRQPSNKWKRIRQDQGGVWGPGTPSKVSAGSLGFPILSVASTLKSSKSE